MSPCVSQEVTSGVSLYRSYILLYFIGVDPADQLTLDKTGIAFK